MLVKSACWVEKKEDFGEVAEQPHLTTHRIASAI